MSTICAPSLDEDRPPAGTPCTVCKTLGHFCQATIYLPGDGERGICKPCRDQKDCPVLALRRGTPEQPDPFTIPRVRPEVKQENRRNLIEHLLKSGKTVREIKHEEGFSEHTILEVRATIPENELPKPRMGPLPGTTGKLIERKKAAILLGDGNSIREVAKEAGLNKNTVLSVNKAMATDKQRTNKWNPIFDKLLTLKYGEELELEVPEGYDSKRYANNLRSYLHQSARTMHDYWSVVYFGLNGKIQVGRESRRPTLEETLAAEANDEHEEDSPMKPELAVVTPVTIVAVPREEPKPDMTISRAFEIVVREMESNLDNLVECKEEEGMAEAIEHDEDVVNTLRCWHPANLGTSSEGHCLSIYERAMARAESELRIINLELQRLQMRKQALEPMLAALKANIEGETESR